MRNRLAGITSVLNYLGRLYRIAGLVLVVPLAVMAYYAWQGRDEASWLCYALPAAGAWLAGVVLQVAFRPRVALGSSGAMLVCALGWITVSAFGAVPFWLGLKISFLDAYFEALSGFTTTGITMLHGLQDLPRSVLFWRSLTQWLGGLGILSFFLAVSSTGRTAHKLYSAESHKIFLKRPVPGLFHALQILWGIYAALTVAAIAALALEGLSPFDAILHGLTAASTGGFSPYDGSIGHFEQAGYAHYAAIEYTIIVVMVLSAVNFFVHYRVLTGGFSALWDNLEMRMFWGVGITATLLVLLDRVLEFGTADLADTFRGTLFQVTAMLTTAGFATEDIGGNAFPALSKLIFLALMVTGGCVGSTSGGIKLLRIGVLWKMVARQLRRVIYGTSAVSLLTVDNTPVETEEARRVSAIFFVWIVLLFFGGAITALFSELPPLQAASGMFSALGNIGPCYISAGDMITLHPAIKLTYIAGMLAGRLEILPVLLLLTRQAWR